MASHSHPFTHGVTLTCDARQRRITPLLILHFSFSSASKGPKHLQSDAPSHHPPPTTLLLLLPAPPCNPTTALTAISCRLEQILACSVARPLPGLEPHFPPPPSLNGNFVQQSLLLSNQRIPQKSHLLVITLLLNEHVGFSWLHLQRMDPVFVVTLLIYEFCSPEGV